MEIAEASSQEPVSYTHLDVYKRQMYGRVKRIYKNGKERLLNSWVKKNRSGSCYMLIKIHCKETKVSYVVWEAFNGLVPDGYACLLYTSRCV